MLPRYAGGVFRVFRGAEGEAQNLLSGRPVFETLGVLVPLGGSKNVRKVVRRTVSEICRFLEIFQIPFGFSVFFFFFFFFLLLIGCRGWSGGRVLVNYVVTRARGYRPGTTLGCVAVSTGVTPRQSRWRGTGIRSVTADARGSSAIGQGASCERV